MAKIFLMFHAFVIVSSNRFMLYKTIRVSCISFFKSVFDKNYKTNIENWDLILVLSRHGDTRLLK